MLIQTRSLASLLKPRVLSRENRIYLFVIALVLSLSAHSLAAQTPQSQLLLRLHQQPSHSAIKPSSPSKHPSVPTRRRHAPQALAPVSSR